MLTGQELGAAIRAAIKIKGITQKALAQHFNVTAPSVNGWIKDGRIDKTNFLKLMGFFSDVVGPEHWGLPESYARAELAPWFVGAHPELYGSDTAKEAASETSTAAGKVLEMLSKSRGISESVRSQIAKVVDEAVEEKVQERTGNVIRADFARPGLVGDEIRIAHYDVRASLGDGQQVPDFPEMLKDLVVSQRHLQELGVTFKDHRHLKLMTGWGQSMGATIQHLDPMIVDASIRDFQGDGIYAFVWQGLFYVKRLQVYDAEHFEMISDNPAHKDRIVRMDDIYIQAHVLLVWNAKRV